MKTTTYYGEFSFDTGGGRSELAIKLARMLCQLNHPSMTGRTVDLSEYLEPFAGRERPTRLSW